MTLIKRALLTIILYKKQNIFDWINLKNYLTTTNFATFNYLDEIILRTEKFMDLYNSFDNSIIKKFEQSFEFNSEHGFGRTFYDFRMILIKDKEIFSLPNNTDRQRHLYLNKYSFNYYTLHDFAVKCNKIRSIILTAYPEISKTLDLIYDPNNNIKKTPYKIALLNEIGFFDLPKLKSLTQEKQIEIIMNLIGGTSRQIKGNMNVLNPHSKEDRIRYTSFIYESEVAKFIENISN